MGFAVFFSEKKSLFQGIEQIGKLSLGGATIGVPTSGKILKNLRRWVRTT